MPSDGAREPLVAILLATFDGAAWIDEQLASFERQQGVRLFVIAGDDASSDDTPERLRAWSSKLDVTLLPAPSRLGSANRTFLRLICDAPIPDGAEYIALSDQDDVWCDDKLVRAVRAIGERGLDVYSSDVTAFWPDGRRRTLGKANAPRRFDYVFEPAGPGCTYVFTRKAFDGLREFSRTRRERLVDLRVHDWWIHAYARVRGLRWWIDPRPGLLYRQHGANESGANVGWAAAKRRWADVREGRFRRDAIAVARAVDDPSEIARLLERFGPFDRLRLALAARHCRRRPLEALLLACFHLIARRT